VKSLNIFQLFDLTDGSITVDSKMVKMSVH